MRKLIAHSRGDTIVEVLIAMAVAAAVMGSVFGVVNRTLKNARQAQEHGEALKIGESQVERIKQLSHDSPTTLFSASPKTHCTTSDGSLINFNPSVNDVPGTDESLFPAECKNLGSVGYRTGFTYEAGSPAISTDDVFRVYVIWPGVTGLTDQVSLSYKVGP